MSLLIDWKWNVLLSLPQPLRSYFFLRSILCSAAALNFHIGLSKYSGLKTNACCKAQDFILQKTKARSCNFIIFFHLCCSLFDVGLLSIRPSFLLLVTTLIRSTAEIQTMWIIITITRWRWHWHTVYRISGIKSDYILSDQPARRNGTGVEKNSLGGFFDWNKVSNMNTNSFLWTETQLNYIWMYLKTFHWLKSDESSIPVCPEKTFCELVQRWLPHLFSPLMFLYTPQIFVTLQTQTSMHFCIFMLCRK